MAIGSKIRTYYEGKWHKGDVYAMRASDHAVWLGSSVFDGARYFEGVAPDLLAHCARVNASAKALMLEPSVSPEDMVALIWEGLADFGKDEAVYIRPMYWATGGDPTAIVPDPETTVFSIALESAPFAPPDATVTLGRTQFCRPVLESSVVNAKAGCLYPNNARMLKETRARGFSNALVADALGNVAETATANVFIVRDGVISTPVPNGTFLAGITRARHIANLRADGRDVRETVLSFDDVTAADEVFITGNMNKITPVTRFEDRHYQSGPITKRARDLYWDWAHSA